MKILIYAHDPGGANTILPLIEPLKQRGHNVFIYGAGSALNILPDIIEYEKDSEFLIKKINPDFIITGTSASCMTEKTLRKEAKNYKIPCMSILDHWTNYGIRFSKYSSSEIDEYDKNKTFDYLSDYIIVMDEYAKNQMASEGIPEKIIYPLGNPYFGYIKDEFEKLNVHDLRKSLLNGKKKLAVWGSLPFIEDFGYGDEITALSDIVELLPKEYELVIKPHPREKLEKSIKKTVNGKND